ncbi:Transposase, Mutator family [Micromonospora chaiyaphumensis]|uniref:Mutator family transposase n=1 Tax=Micromonospora chaiyaphumensis TaxID=307119 RepID=A0A1C4W7S2_9ACTN|nr:Transposase, Mutator family [Micromonospora chaiyaphumensis]
MVAVDTAAVAMNGPGRPAEGVDAELIAQLVEQARAAGLQLTGDGGLLQQLTKRVLESALEGEITGHLGYDKGDPRDRDGSFGPQIVKERQRRLSGVDDMVISLSAKVLTTGEIQAHLAEVYGAEVSRQTISTITDKVIEGMTEWQNRPPGPGLPGDLPGCGAREDPRREGRQPAYLPGPGSQGRGHPGHPGPVGR